MESWYAPTATGNLPAVKQVLVIAPHPDDEIFGPGGTLKRFCAAGSSVQVCILTDGAGYALKEERSQVFSIRQQESCAASAALHIAQPIFLGLPDRGLAGCASLVSMIKKLLEQFQPQVVLAPSLWEIHPDHLAAARATVAALALQNATQSVSLPELWFYEVGAPLRTNFLVDITSVWTDKKAAMECFFSQNSVQNYTRHVEALNIYRTYSLPHQVSHAEAFFRLSLEELKDLLEKSKEVPGPFSGLQIQSVLSAAESQAEHLQTQLSAASIELSKLRGEYDKNQILQNKITELENKNIDLERQRQSLLGSSSWRITAPLRWVSEFYSKKRGH